MKICRKCGRTLYRGKCIAKDCLSAKTVKIVKQAVKAKKNEIIKDMKRVESQLLILRKKLKKLEADLSNACFSPPMGTGLDKEEFE